MWGTSSAIGGFDRANPREVAHMEPRWLDIAWAGSMVTGHGQTCIWQVNTCICHVNTSIGGINCMGIWVTQNTSSYAQVQWGRMDIELPWYSFIWPGATGHVQTTLKNPIAVSHRNFLEPTLILLVRITKFICFSLKISVGDYFILCYFCPKSNIQCAGTMSYEDLGEG